ncbi:MAG TPA: hypothetical protein VEU33_30880 [Archangium sp.]|nr:hypothetical protein [Archangium sp.]
MANSLSGIAKDGIGAMGQLSGAKQEMLDKAPAEMRPFLEAQMKMQKEQELTQLITQMMKQMHEMAMSVIRNIGG